MINQKYGVVYTPESLAGFVARLLCRFINVESEKTPVIIDPASGECALLSAIKAEYGDKARYIGIDVDKDAIRSTKGIFDVIYNDAIMPINVSTNAGEYWRRKLKNVDAIIANPPWSSEKIYDKELLIQSGYSLVDGQYDSYVLFIELAYKMLNPGGVMGFIIPDSIFDSQNEKLRRFLATQMEILVIARLGEKIFDEVNRATTVILCKKILPNDNSLTECFRLTTANRKAYLAGKGSLDSFYYNEMHKVKQARFLKNSCCLFDVDTHAEEEKLIDKIQKDTIDWETVFKFGRGVEISKSGSIVYCPYCEQAQGYAKKQLQEGTKKCVFCNMNFPVIPSTVTSAIEHTKGKGRKPIFVGENIQRYRTVGNCYIKTGIDGINYKSDDLYISPKLLIRKTGLGIYATVDYSGALTSQTVYILKYAAENNTPLEYYLALINSRVVYYYYLKNYGENEWKSHPYLTKQIIFSLPIKPYSGDSLDEKITKLSKNIQDSYDYKMDLELEKLIMKKYGLTNKEQSLIVDEMNKLPDLSAINNMKMENK